MKLRKGVIRMRSIKQAGIQASGLRQINMTWQKLLSQALEEETNRYGVILRYLGV